MFKKLTLSIVFQFFELNYFLTLRRKGGKEEGRKERSLGARKAGDILGTAVRQASIPDHFSHENHPETA